MIAQTMIADVVAANLRPIVRELCSMAIGALCRMYRPDQRLFCFHIRKAGDSEVVEGVSHRYTATVLLTLAGYDRQVAELVLEDHSPEDVCNALIDQVQDSKDLGAVALTLWAARALSLRRTGDVLRQLKVMLPDREAYPTVEVAWALTALSIPGDAPSDAALAERIAVRLLASFNRHSGLFPHWPAGVHSPWLRSHVTCYADFVYPIQALSWYHLSTGHTAAVDTAGECAARMCELQGPHGQWWWHYDVRTGRVVERYPVYAVHQDAMGPMALHDLQKTGFADFGTFERSIARGVQWLMDPPEIDHSLVDQARGIIWRKVYRSEVRRLVRTLQAGTSRLHHSLRLPGVDRLFPPGNVDYESRPYEMAWILYAWRGEESGT